MRKQSTSFKNKKLGPAKKPELVSDIPYHELLIDSFKAVCTYRFYNSHTKAMALRKEELEQSLKKKEENIEFQHIMDEEDVFTSQLGLRAMNQKRSSTSLKA